MTNNRFGQKSVGALASLALGASMIVASAGVAVAAPPVLGNIDESAETMLTIHKYEEQKETVTDADVTGVIDPGFENPLAGVVFTAYPLLDQEGAPVDLLTQAGWDGLDSATFAGTSCQAPAGYTIDLDAGIEFSATDASGAAALPLAIGAYVVCETEAPQTVTKRSAPFLVTIPYPATESGVDAGWIYDVHVYPKNEVTTFEKTVEEQNGLGLGAAVDFTITSAVPDIGDRDWEHFAITDTLDPRLAAAAPYATVVSPVGVAVDIRLETYIDTDTGVTHDRVIVEFTDMDWLKNNAGAEIEVTIHTTVAEVLDGSIDNEGQQWVNNPDLDKDDSENPPTTTPEVTTNWGSVELLKIAADGQDTPLEGAIFEVYPATVPYPVDGVCTIETSGSALEFVIDGATTTQITSDDLGIIHIPGLFISDSEHDPINAQDRCYVLVEVQAPAGYVTPEGDSAKHAISVAIGENTADLYDPIENTQQEVPELPLTGAAGQTILLLLSAATGVIVVGLIMVNRRRQKVSSN